jgi:GNAT superfamily N-acetyltransferase
MAIAQIHDMDDRLIIIATSECPKLAEITGAWRWETFMKGSASSHAEVLAAERKTALEAPAMPLTLVLLVNDVPAGMASLTAHDLDERPDLSPWLAGVFVAPEHRGNGYAARLVRAVEQAATDAGIPALWLYTRVAEGLYAKLDWQTAERFS